MLEPPSFLISRDLPAACFHESEWAYNTWQVIEQAKQRPRRRLRRSLDRNRSGAGTSPPPAAAECSGEADCSSGGGGRDSCDRTSLIPDLGFDGSVNCVARCSRSDYGCIGSLNRSFRRLVRSGELYTLRRAMGIREHWVYFSCDLLQWQAFDVAGNRWMLLPPMPPNECFMCSDKESLAVGTELLVFGKEIMSPVIYKYSILENSWSSGMAMGTPRCLFASASTGETAFFAGGCDPSGNVLSSAELYNSETGVWARLPCMSRPRKMCSGVFMSGKFYVLGGIGDGVQQLTCGEVYDPETGRWSVVRDMYPGWRDGGVGGGGAEAPPLLAVVGDRLFAADHDERVVKRYDEGENVWTTLGRLPETAVSMNGWGLAFRACGDRLIVVGGPRGVAGGVVELNSWAPEDGPPVWRLLARRHSGGSFVYNCAVMGC